MKRGGEKSGQSSENKADYRRWLLDILLEKKRKNAAYSLRAFSHQLDISAASLSQILSGKRPLTERTALKIAEKLKLSPLEKDELIEMVRHPGKSTLPQDLNADEFIQLQDDVFRFISDWYHYPILELSLVPGSKASADWISKRLGITVGEAAAALRRLQALGLIEIRGQKYVQTKNRLTTDHTIPSEAIRKLHLQTLRKAGESLHKEPMENRFLSAITVAIDPRDLPRAIECINAFRHKMHSMLEKGRSRERIYTLSLQLFPMDKAEVRPS